MIQLRTEFDDILTQQTPQHPIHIRDNRVQIDHFRRDKLAAAERQELTCQAGRTIREVSDGCLQFWGGMGYMMDSPVSRIWRDGRLSSIGGGADEVMLQILSKFMGTFPAKS